MTDAPYSEAHYLPTPQQEQEEERKERWLDWALLIPIILLGLSILLGFVWMAMWLQTWVSRW